MATVTGAASAQEQRISMWSGYLIVIVGFLATTLAQPQAIGRIPFQNLLKNSLNVSRTLNAGFFFWIGLPWYFKPIVGVFTDAFPLFGSRRKTYIVLSTALASVSWLGLYLTPVRYSALINVCLVIDFFMVIASTVLGAYMVEAAQSNSGSGRLTSARQVTYWITTMVSGPLGGWLAARAFGATIGLSSVLVFVIAPVAFFSIYEQNKRMDSRELLVGAKRQLGNIARAGSMWAARV